MRYTQHATIMNNTFMPLMAANSVAEIPTFPREIMLTTTFNCNYRCKMCFQDHYDKREMPWEMVEKLRDALYFADTLQIIGGEPLLYSRFEDLVSLAYETSTKVRITTNGSLLNKEMNRFIVENEIFNLRISVDAGTAATYKHIRGGNFLKLINAVRDISLLKQAAGARWPIVEFNVVAQKSNVGELPKLIAMAGALGVYQVNVHYMTCHSEQWLPESLYFHQEYSDECMHKAALAAKAVGMLINLPKPFAAPDDEQTRVVTKCEEPWRVFMVNMDGVCNICCGGADSPGNLNEMDFMEMWNGAFMKNLRSTVNGPDRPDFCRKCFGRMQKVESLYTHFARPLAERIKAGTLAPAA
jgi:MoaA/NifB/PqqE/SkfB family radical SAM enzyme